MKVGSTESLPELPRPAGAKPAVAPPIQDKQTASAAAGVGMAKQAVENVRVARIQELTSQIKSGSYQPSAQQIADSILETALLDAQLEAAG